jgi:Flp pilus assembly protein TadG
MRYTLSKTAKFGRARNGAVAIEFAIIGVPFLMALGWIIEFGVMQFTEYALQNAVQDAGRKLRVGTTAVTATQFRDEICSRATMISSCQTELGVWVESADTFGAITVPAIRDISTGDISTFSPGRPEQAVVIFAVHDWNFAFPFMQAMGNLGAATNARRLYGMTTFRNEP